MSSHPTIPHPTEAFKSIPGLWVRAIAAAAESNPDVRRAQVEVFRLGILIRPTLDVFC